MRSALRSVIAVLGGAVVGMFVIAGIEYISTLAFPPAIGLDPRNADDRARIAAEAPLGAQLLVIAAWTIGSFIAAYVATKLARSSGALHGRIVTALILIGTVFNLAQFAHPAWMWAAGILGVLIGGLGGVQSAVRATPATDPAF